MAGHKRCEELKKQKRRGLRGMCKKSPLERIVAAAVLLPLPGQEVDVDPRLLDLGRRDRLPLRHGLVHVFAHDLEEPTDLRQLVDPKVDGGPLQGMRRLPELEPVVGPVALLDLPVVVLELVGMGARGRTSCR
jgi:hypothetical protein